jgi:hypothetical protein
MVAALVLPISGPYIGTWNSLPLGTQHDDGYDLRCVIQGQELNQTDAYGMTLVEGIYRGQNWRCLLRGVEFNKTGLLAALQAFGQSGANTTLTPILSNVGNRFSAFAQTLLLNAILANPPTMPQSLNASNAIVAPQMQSNFLLTSKYREMPLEMVLLPYQFLVGSVNFNVPFSTT